MTIKICWEISDVTRVSTTTATRAEDQCPTVHRTTVAEGDYRTRHPTHRMTVTVPPARGTHRPATPTDRTGTNYRFNAQKQKNK